MVTLYYIKDNEIISLNFLMVLNLANIFILFFMYFLFLDRNRTVVIRQPPEDNNHLVSYEINFNDIYEPVLGMDFPEDEDKCSICLENFNFSENSSVIKTRHCSHYYHENCIKRWLRIRPKCPNCNVNLVARWIEDE